MNFSILRRAWSFQTKLYPPCFEHCFRVSSLAVDLEGTKSWSISFSTPEWSAISNTKRRVGEGELHSKKSDACQYCWQYSTAFLDSPPLKPKRMYIRNQQGSEKLHNTALRYIKVKNLLFWLRSEINFPSFRQFSFGVENVAHPTSQVSSIPNATAGYSDWITNSRTYNSGTSNSQTSNGTETLMPEPLTGQNL